MATITPTTTKLSSRNFLVTWSSIGINDVCTEYQIVDAELDSYQFLGVADHINVQLKITNEPTFTLSTAHVFDSSNCLNLATTGTNQQMPPRRFQWIAPKPLAGGVDSTGAATVIVLFHGD